MLTDYDAIVIGTSAGGFAALAKILPHLSRALPQAVIVVQHLHPEGGEYIVNFFSQHCSLPVKEAEDKEPILPGVIYIAAAGYHLLIERDKSFSLSLDDKINFARPSIDILFETAAMAYGSRLVGVILTGANADGACGLAAIKASGGLTIVQDPKTAEISFMPQAAFNQAQPDHILDLTGIARLLG
ncbi:MAG: chemotaxis protein CheB [Desulfobulbaceae bacterium]|nr:chemotaxis protein CheB [Desulfobulbaceae bacterium]